MTFRPASECTSSRPIKSPKRSQTHTYSSRQQFPVPGGQNWVYASGGLRPIRFDFGRALDEQIASEDETCGSSQEYYARKAASFAPGHNRTFIPPAPSTSKPDLRFMYPTQRANYSFNFDRTTPIDVENMNTALPFGPTQFPERKHKTGKDVGKVARSPLPEQIHFEFGSKSTTFSVSPPASPAQIARTHLPASSPALSARSQNHDGSFRRSHTSKSHITATRRK